MKEIDRRGVRRILWRRESDGVGCLSGDGDLFSARASSLRVALENVAKESRWWIRDLRGGEDGADGAEAVEAISVVIVDAVIVVIEMSRPIRPLYVFTVSCNYADTDEDT